MLVVDYFEKEAVILKDGDESIFVDKSLLPDTLRVGDVIRIKVNNIKVETEEEIEEETEEETETEEILTKEALNEKALEVMISETTEGYVRPSQISSVAVTFPTDTENMAVFRMTDKLEMTERLLPEDVSLPCIVDFIIDQKATEARTEAIHKFEDEYDKKDTVKFVSTYE